MHKYMCARTHTCKRKRKKGEGERERDWLGQSRKPYYLPGMNNGAFAWDMFTCKNEYSS